MMLWLLASLAMLVASGGLAWLLAGRPRLASALGVSGAVLASVCGLVSVGLGWSAPAVVWRWPWPQALGSVALGLDPASVFFLLPIFLLSALAAIYGHGYLPRQGRHASHWLFYNLLTASMVLVVASRDGLLFLMAWELMSVSSYFLVTREHSSETVRQAGWIYLLAGHLGAAFLLVLFLLLGQKAGSLEFYDILKAGGPAVSAGVIFLLALVGFGAKAGLAPLHVWLPEAHPAAPSHVSSLMSGAMITLGLYGILRVITLAGSVPLWWGYTLIAVGAVSGILGVFLALAQHDLKRLLAYSSVENMGLITMSLGAGLLGVSLQSPGLAVLGMTAGLLHVVNHACFKGLLFLGAGAILHSAGHVNLNRLGGLLKRMPAAGSLFLLASAAIAGLPPLNGFASEFLMYMATFHGGLGQTGATAAVLFAGVLVLASISGLAVAVFTKAAGAAWLGAPRSPEAETAHAPNAWMLAPMAVLAVLCVGLGLAAGWLIPGLGRVVAQLSRMPLDVVQAQLAPWAYWLKVSGVLGLALIATGAALWGFRARRLAGKEEAGLTWDCGYAQPTSRMQYTAASFSEPLEHTFRRVLRPQRKFQRPQGLFPAAASLQVEMGDLFRRWGYDPLFRRIGRLLQSFRWIQHGWVQFYVLYILLALAGLLIWKLGGFQP